MKFNKLVLASDGGDELALVHTTETRGDVAPPLETDFGLSITVVRGDDIATFHFERPSEARSILARMLRAVDEHIDGHGDNGSINQ